MPTLQHVIGELPHKRTKNSKHYLLSDGSFQAVIFMSDVHYEDENGNLQNIDTDLYDEADFDVMEFPVSKHKCDSFRARRQMVIGAKNKGVLDREKFDFHALRVPFAATIPRNFRKGYSIGKGENKLTFKPVGASVSVGRLNEEKRNEVEYQDAWNDVDVKLELTERGIKETLILKTAKAPTEFSFQVEGNIADDLTAGELLLENAWLEDAAGVRRDVQQKVRREGGKVFVDITVDVTDLTFPVVVDPTVTIQNPSATQDTYIETQTPDANHGSEQRLYAGRYNNATYITLINIPLDAIPQGSSILDAKLQLYLENYNVISGDQVTLRIDRITSQWEEGAVTYNSRPSFVSDSNGTRVFSGAPQVDLWYDFDCKNSLQKWSEGGNYYGLRLAALAQTGTFRLWFRSREYPSLAPKLVVTYNQPPTAPTVTAPNGGEMWNAQHTITWIGGFDPSTNTIDNLNGSNSGTFTTTSTNARFVQTFTVPSDVDQITEVAISFGAGSSGNAFLALFNVSGSTPTTEISGTRVSLSVSAGLTKSIPVSWNVTPNKRYAVGIIKDIIDPTINIGVEGLLNEACYYYNGSSWVKYNDNDMKVRLSFIKRSDNLQYQIQLTTDEGQNWHDIVSLTPAGATSYDYDFTNEPETSLAKVRIRAYDGYGYGPWDESDGVFTIQHNVAPTAPTNLTPSGGNPVDRNNNVRLSWQHNDPNSSDPQSKFDLQWRPVGSGNWNTVSQVTPNQYWDAPAGTFPRGNIEWQVRTYDQAGLSGPYSAQETFFAGDKPFDPTIISPTDGGIVAVARPTLQWSSADQVAYQVQVLDLADTVLWDSSVVSSTNKAIGIGYDLSNNTQYKLKVRIQNADGLWSDWDTITVTVSYTPPAAPVLSITNDEADGRIRIAITNPSPQGTEPNVVSNDLYRRKTGETTWTRIKTGIPNSGIYDDYAAASGDTYEYMARAWGDNGTFTDSLPSSGHITLKGIWLHCVDDPSGTAHRFALSSGNSDEWRTDGSLMKFAGRKRPVAVFGENEDGRITANLQMLRNRGDREALQNIISRKTPVCYRDNRGRKMFGVIFQLPSNDTFYGYSVQVSIDEIDYKEEV